MRSRLLALLKVPESPDPPPGSGDSLTTFRASIKHLYLSALLWLPRQVSALVGLVFALVFFGSIDLPFFNFGGEAFTRRLRQFQFEFGGMTFDPISLINFFELFAVVFFVFQLIFSLAMLKLSWEMRWYMVGDQSLRIREGLWSLREQTVTIANIQNMTVKQGPLQKLFGISDLEVQTAGGGPPSDLSDFKEGLAPLHIASFCGLEDAQALRNRIQERLMAFKGAGLGDDDEPEERSTPDVSSGASVTSSGLAEAATELRDEARALRRAMTL